MKIIKPEARIIPKGNSPYKFIEMIGRTCYKSLDKITDDSAVKFVKGLVDRKHYAMLEHYWVHIIINALQSDVEEALERYAEDLRLYGGVSEFDKFVQVTGLNRTYVSAPLRVFLEFDEKVDMFTHRNNHNYSVIDRAMADISRKFPELLDTEKWYIDEDYEPVEVLEEDEFIESMQNDFEDCGYACTVQEPMKHRTHTVLFICDRGVSHEFVRHRVCNFAQESTRYCNYSKDKFGSEITVIKPCFFDRNPDTPDNVLWDNSCYTDWLRSCEESEQAYFRMIKKGATPQEARSVLPNSLKTELIITANEAEWQHIIDLRFNGVTGAPHPQMKEAMSKIVENLYFESEGRLYYDPKAFGGMKNE